MEAVVPGNWALMVGAEEVALEHFFDFDRSQHFEIAVVCDLGSVIGPYSTWKRKNASSS